MISNLYKIYSEVLEDPAQNNYLAKQIGSMIQMHKETIFSDGFDILDHLQPEEEYNAGLLDDSAMYQSETGETKDFKVVDKDVAEPGFTVQAQEKDNFKDYRISTYTIKNFRKFSHHDTIPYGFNFQKDGVICSAVFCGFNGCGKSSLFEGLRYCYKLIDNEDYLHHAKDKDTEIEIKTCSKDGSDETCTEQIQPLLNAFFCDEEDVLTNGPVDNEELNFAMYKALGYGKAYEFYRKLESAIDSVKNYQIYATTPESYEGQIKKQNRLVLQMTDDFQTTLEDIKKFKSVDINETDAFLRSLDIKIYFSYNRNVDRQGLLDTRTNRMIQLNEEARRIIDTLKAKKQQIADKIPFYTALMECIDRTIALFNQTLLDRHSGKHPNRMSECYQALSTISITSMNSQFAYYIQRAKRLNGYARAEESNLPPILLREAKMLIAENNRLVELRGNVFELNKQKNNAKIAGDLNDFCIAFRNKLLTHLGEIMAPIAESVKELLREFNGDEDSVEVDYSDGSISINYAFLQSSGKPLAEFQPQEYLNSFRLKMYSLSLKIALAFAVMKERNFVFPLILDDVFYANDFFNREKVKEYFENIYKTYKRHCPDFPELQTILFTHDEVVFEAAANGICKYTKCLQGKLFDQFDVDEEDKERNGYLTPYYKIYVHK